MRTRMLNKEEELITLSEIALKNLPALSGSAEFLNQQMLISFEGFGWGGPNLELAPGEPDHEMIKYSVESFDFYLESGLDYLIKRFGKIVIDCEKNAGEDAQFSVIMVRDDGFTCWFTCFLAASLN